MPTDAMQSMSEDDAAYSALLAQLLSDSATTRNARVHSWIEHQYNFVLSENARPPSPSPSSSLGVHHIDRPDSPLLPRLSSERASSPSYDALFLPAHPSPDDDFEEKERIRALRFIVQEMAQWKSPSSLPHPNDKPLPAPPPSPVSTTHSSRAIRSRSSSNCISRLPSFTSTLSSDQSQPQEIPPPLPVSVIVHGEYQHDLILRDRPIVNGYLHRRDDSFPPSLMHSQDYDAQYLCPIQDDKDSFQPSPTISTFSCAYSRETSFTTPYPSSLASPTSTIFSSSPCLPENIALPASPPDEDKSFFSPSITAPPSSKSSHSLSSVTVSPPKTNVLPASPTSHDFLPENTPADRPTYHLRPPNEAAASQSRWSLTTTASLTPSTVKPISSSPLVPRTPPKEKKGVKTPKKRARFISLISRLSPGRTDPSSTTASSQTGDDVEYDSTNDSDTEDKEKKPRKSLGKRPSLASLRASFSISRASFSSQRPPISSAVGEVPPLPISPTLSSMAETCMPPEVSVPLPKRSLSKIPSRSNMLNSILPPIPQSASTTTTFQSVSQLSLSDASALSASDSRVSLVCPTNTPNGSRISLLPPPSNRTSLASATGVRPVASTKPASTNQATAQSKPILRLTPKSKGLKIPTPPGNKETATPSRLPVVGNTFLPSPTTSRIPQAPTKFNPPAKLATVIASESRQASALASPAPISPTLKLPVPQSRISSKVPRPSVIIEKLPLEGPPSFPPSSRLPMPASAKGARVGTVKGFWKRP